MFKTILAFIKAHTIATAITTTVVVSTAVATPIIVENYKLDKNVKENLDMLVSSDYKSASDNKEAEKNVILNNDEQPTENISTNNKEQLTFTVKRIETSVDGGTSIEYKIIPNYDKDYSQWSKSEKEAYQKAFNEALELSKEENERLKAKEEQTMQNMEMLLSKVMQSYSKEYYFMNTDEAAWRYNSYTKLYDSGTATQIYGESIYKTIQISGGNLSGVTKEDFRSIVYPAIKRKLNKENSMYQQMMDDLEELYHLSD